MKPIDADARAQWIALSLSPHIGGKTFSNLLRHFKGDLSAVFGAAAADLRAVPGVGPKIARDILGIDPTRIARDIIDWEGQGIRILTTADDGYPQPLSEVDDRPPTLFLRGVWQPGPQDRSIGIVGTRDPSQVAKILTLQLATRSRALAASSSVVWRWARMPRRMRQRWRPAGRPSRSSAAAC